MRPTSLWFAALAVALGLGAAEARPYPSGRGDAATAASRSAEPLDLAPCASADLDCRAFTGTLLWQPDERGPLLSAKALRRLVLLRHVPGGERERALRCLAFIAWAEARSEGLKGMQAVVAVVLNRSRSPAFPLHPCDVIGQAGAFEPLARPAHRATVLALKRRALAPFPRPANPVEAASLRTARLLVWRLAQAPGIADPTGGATHFVAPGVLRARGQPMPAWTRGMVLTARIGGHHFYRAPDPLLARGS